MKWQKLFRLFFFEHFFCVGCQTDWRSSFERAPEDTRVARRNRAGAAAVFCQHGGAVQRFHQQPPGRWLLHSFHGVWHRWWRYGSLYLLHFFFLQCSTDSTKLISSKSVWNCQVFLMDWKKICDCHVLLMTSMKKEYVEARTPIFCNLTLLPVNILC